MNLRNFRSDGNLHVHAFNVCIDGIFPRSFPDLFGFFTPCSGSIHPVEGISSLGSLRMCFLVKSFVIVSWYIASLSGSLRRRVFILLSGSKVFVGKAGVRFPKKSNLIPSLRVGDRLPKGLRGVFFVYGESYFRRGSVSFLSPG